MTWRGDLLPPVGALINRDDAAMRGVVRLLTPNASPGGPGSTVRDLSPFVGDGTLAGGAIWRPDQNYPQWSVHCLGSGNSRLECGAPFAQQQGGQSWMLRFRYNGNTPTQNSVLAAYDNGAGGVGRVILGILDSAGGGGPFSLFNTYANGTANGSAATIGVGNEYFVGLTFDGTTATFYRNGLASGPTFTPAVNALVLPAKIWIGAYTNAASSANIDILEFICWNWCVPASVMWHVYNPATRGHRYIVRGR